MSTKINTYAVHSWRIDWNTYFILYYLFGLNEFHISRWKIARSSNVEPQIDIYGRFHKIFCNCWIYPVTTLALLQFIDKKSAVWCRPPLPLTDRSKLSNRPKDLSTVGRFSVVKWSLNAYSKCRPTDDIHTICRTMIDSCSTDLSTNVLPKEIGHRRRKNYDLSWRTQIWSSDERKV